MYSYLFVEVEVPFKEYLQEAKRSAIFTQVQSQGEAWFHLRMSRIVFAAIIS